MRVWVTHPHPTTRKEEYFSNNNSEACFNATLYLKCKICNDELLSI